ncbi:hypothetical protein EUX98_g1244 [Antrodiella citrinella]|uniref:Major facilitator superfamily (MFS) profile domain-containing protein n=1 Tax=Antrodiella citrinella TaxID=2447956 RepID=A0A4S4N3G6_9APHY|nr:hypothetical protein EUX98_g1244 [Antrodiella citrinella]
MSTKSSSVTLPATDPEKQRTSQRSSSELKENDVASPSPPAAPKLSGLRKAAILAMLCSAQFFDIFNACSSIAALPSIGTDLYFTPGMLQWVLAAYTLTFGSMQVPAGRLSDLYNPKPIFIAGYLAVGIFSILCGVSIHPIMLLVFRAVSGIGAAMTIPSAIAMIVINFPEPKEQAKALGMYGAAGAVGNAIGFVVGGVLAAKASWRWVFHLIGLCTVPFALLSWFCLPRTPTNAHAVKRSMDLPGITILTGGLILFVYAISDGGESGWGTPRIITTLVFSIVFFIGFFIVERYVKDPAIPPRMWFNKNFAAMFFYSWSVYWNLMSAELLLIQVFQDLYHWSPISAATHCIPLGITGLFSTIIVGTYGHLIPRRYNLISGQLLMLTALVLFALADTPSKYWSHIFPGMIINMVGLGQAYVGASATMMSNAPAGEEGVVGAILYTSFQIGSTVGIAVVSSIAFGVNHKQPGDALSQFRGYAAAFWSQVAMHGVCVVMSVLFVRD